MKKARLVLFLEFVTLYLAVPVTGLAQVGLSYPPVYGGTAQIDGGPVPEGRIVTAMIDGARVASGNISNGHRSLFIPEPTGKIYRQRIFHFTIGGMAANESVNWRSAGAVINFTVSTGTQELEDAFAPLISNGNLLRVWHFDPRTQHDPPHYGWSPYDARPVYANGNTLEAIHPRRFYFVQVQRHQHGVRVGGSTVDFFAGWDPVVWPQTR